MRAESSQIRKETNVRAEEEVHKGSAEDARRHREVATLFVYAKGGYSGSEAGRISKLHPVYARYHNRIESQRPCAFEGV